MTPKPQEIRRRHPDLTDEDLEQFAEKLETEKNELESLIAAWRQQDQDLRDNREPTSDPSDMAGQFEDRDRTYSQLEEVEKRYSQVTQALERLKQPEVSGYGFCEKCGKPIAKGRLNIDPSFQTCVDHAK